jgi:hypothetical protein
LNFLSLILVPAAKSIFRNAAPLDLTFAKPEHAPNPKSGEATKAISEEDGLLRRNFILRF